jgi:microcystin-dependent protein
MNNLSLIKNKSINIKSDERTNIITDGYLNMAGRLIKLSSESYNNGEIELNSNCIHTTSLNFNICTNDFKIKSNKTKIDAKTEINVIQHRNSILINNDGMNIDMLNEINITAHDKLQLKGTNGITIVSEKSDVQLVSDNNMINLIVGSDKYVNVTDINNNPGQINVGLINAMSVNQYAYGSLEGPNFYQLLPAGIILLFASSNRPSGWLICDGSSYNALVYASLYNIIGNTYGGEYPEFKLPDMRGRTVVGNGQSGELSNYSLAQIGGEERHTLSSSEMPVHNHTGLTETNGNHTHSSNATGSPYSLSTYSGNNTMNSDVNGGGEPDLYAGSVALVINETGSHNHTFTTNNTGGGLSHNNMQPYIVLQYLIKY